MSQDDFAVRGLWARVPTFLTAHLCSSVSICGSEAFRSHRSLLCGTRLDLSELLQAQADRARRAGMAASDLAHRHAGVELRLERVVLAFGPRLAEVRRQAPPALLAPDLA